MELRVLVLARWKELRAQGLLRSLDLKGKPRRAAGRTGLCSVTQQSVLESRRGGAWPEEGPGSLSSN